MGPSAAQSTKIRRKLESTSTVGSGLLTLTPRLRVNDVLCERTRRISEQEHDSVLHNHCLGHIIVTVDGGST